MLSVNIGTKGGRTNTAMRRMKFGISAHRERKKPLGKARVKKSISPVFGVDCQGRGWTSAFYDNGKRAVFLQRPCRKLQILTRVPRSW